MGVNLKDIAPAQPLDFKELERRTVAVDAMNFLYQFLSSIRQRDGTPLMDSNGNITSHLSGLFYRNIKLLEKGIEPIYVFDGEPPEAKRKEIERRKKAKKKARRKWKKALEEERMEDAKKYAQRTSSFSDEMIKDAKRVLSYMGIPYVQAPSEGEAQAVVLLENEDVWAVASQDYDALLFGTSKLVKGLTLSGYANLELIVLDEVLSDLGITREQLVDIAILVGTDFNEGVKGIGPKTALKYVKEDRVKEVETDFDMDEIRDIFLDPEVKREYDIEWGEPDEDALVSFLCEDRDFSPDRIRTGVKNLRKALRDLSQQGLDQWF